MIPNKLAKNIIHAAFPEYHGRKAQVRVDPGPFDVRSYWDGGSRTFFAIVDINTLNVHKIPAQSPFDQPIPTLDSLRLSEGKALVSSSIFMGKQGKVIVYVTPEDAHLFEE